MNKPEIYNEKSVVSTTKNTVEVSGKQLVQALNEAYNLNIPTAAEVSVSIPGGGDWSNCDLDIEGSTNVDITWTEVEYN